MAALNRELCLKRQYFFLPKNVPGDAGKKNERQMQKMDSVTGGYKKESDKSKSFQGRQCPF